MRKCPKCGYTSEDKWFCPKCMASMVEVDDNQTTNANNTNLLNNSTTESTSSKDISKGVSKKTIFVIATIIFGAILIGLFVYANTVPSDSNDDDYSYDDEYYDDEYYDDEDYDDEDYDDEYDYSDYNYSSAAYDLEINIDEAITNYGYAEIEGSVTNNGSQSYSYVKAYFNLYVDEGCTEMINSDYTYVVDSNPLAPGETRRFDIMMDSGGYDYWWYTYEIQ